jgi:hypothetical protein
MKLKKNVKNEKNKKDGKNIRKKNDMKMKLK